MKTLPSCLAAVAEFAAKESRRYAVECIKLDADEAGWTLTATDCNRLITVEGDYPAKNAGDGSKEAALIPAAVFRRAFSNAFKLTKSYTPNVNLTIEPEVKPARPDLDPTPGKTFFSAIHNGKQAQDGCTNSVGRFPSFESVLPTAKEREEYKIVGSYDAKLLGESMIAMATMAGGGYHRVDFLIKDDKTPMILNVAEPRDGIRKVEALIQPLS